MSTPSNAARPLWSRAIEIDESRLPLVRVTIRGTPSEEEFDAYLEAHRRVYARRQRHVTMVDAITAGHIPAVILKKSVEWSRAHEQLIKDCSLGVAFAINSPIVRAAVTTIDWIWPPVRPHHIVATVADAERWAIAQLHAAGLRLPTSRLAAG